MKIIDIQPDDIVVVHMDINKFNFEEIEDTHFLLKSHLKNAVITFPDGIDIKPQSWENIYNYIMSIKPEGVKIKNGTK